MYKKNYLMRFSLNKGKIIASDIKVSYGINPSAAKKKIETVLRFFGEAFPVKEIYIKTGGNLLQLQVDAADNKAILYVDRILFSFRKNWLRKFLRLFNHEWLHLAGEMKPGMSMEKSNLEESMVQITELLLALRQNNIDDIIEDLKDIRGFAYRSREQVLKESVQQQITLYRNLKKDNEVSDFSLDFLLKKVIGVQDDAFKIKLKQMVKERLGIDFELPIKLQLNKIDVLLFQTPGDISIRHKELPLKKDLASISEQAV
ncbi:MAG: hypothetical protein KKA52_01435 [Candidatus Omnitrophica bacterium]|nr:hypothetical protein [Candidatus Omnitrophota bacterium]